MKVTGENVALLIISLIGALLMGFNAGQLANGLNATLFVLGIILLSSSTIFIGLLKTVFNKIKKRDKDEKKQ